MNDCVGSQKSPQKLFYRTKKDIAAKPVGRVFPLGRGRLFWGQCRTAGLRRPKRSVKNFWIVSWISPSGNHSRGTNSTCHSRSRPVSTNKISRNCSPGSRSSSGSSAHFGSRFSSSSPDFFAKLRGGARQKYQNKVADNTKPFITLQKQPRESKL